MSLSAVRLLPSFIRVFPKVSNCKFSTRNHENHCIISCKRSRLNFYTNTIYSNLDEVPLASKGWNHADSRGDTFTIRPVSEANEVLTPFHLLNLDPRLVEALKCRGIQQATGFQVKAIPLINTDKHVLLAAETGCGKTVSYILPIIQNLIDKRSVELNSPKCLVVVPNRELAYQVAEVAQALASSVDLRVSVIVGGRIKKIMMDPEFGEIDILIGTPGAVGKLSTVGVYKLHNVQFTVLDEADTLLDDSFADRVPTIIRRVVQSKIVLVSATMPKRLPDVLGPIEPHLDQLVSPKIHKPLLNITQKFLKLTRSGKPSHLLQIAKANKQPMLVFTNRNETCNWLAQFLRENRVSCSNLNGDMNYAIRIEQWNAFVRGETNILASTDVGSRGLDTTQVAHVVNYDFPVYAADYLHRIGRVGRLGGVKGCKATNFISGPEEVRLVQLIELAIRRDQPLPNVDGNITNIVQKKIQKGMRQVA